MTQACIRRATDRQQRIGLSIANGGQPLLAEKATAAVVQVVQELTAQCAVDAVCVTVCLGSIVLHRPWGYTILLVLP